MNTAKTLVSCWEKAAARRLLSGATSWVVWCLGLIIRAKKTDVAKALRSSRACTSSIALRPCGCQYVSGLARKSPVPVGAIRADSKVQSLDERRLCMHYYLETTCHPAPDFHQTRTTTYKRSAWKPCTHTHPAATTLPRLPRRMQSISSQYQWLPALLVRVPI